MKDEIKLSKRNGSWFATFMGSDAERIERLFTTTTLPTPFRDTMPATEVIRRVAALNPGYAVRS